MALVLGCKEVNQTVHDVFVLDSMYDVKSWILPVANQLHDHSYPHIFRYCPHI